MIDSVFWDAGLRQGRCTNPLDSRLGSGHPLEMRFLLMPCLLMSCLIKPKRLKKMPVCLNNDRTRNYPTRTSAHTYADTITFSEPPLSKPKTSYATAAFIGSPVDS